MSFWHFLGGALAPGHQQAADDANDAINKTLQPGSDYYAPSNYLRNNDGSAIAGAAALQANPVSAPNTYAMDADSAALGALGGQFGDIQAHGGRAEQAAVNQGAADVANTGAADLQKASRAAANQVISTGTQEREMGARGANASRAEQLANQLKQQIYAAAVTHANIQAGIAGKGIQNDAANTQFGIDQALRDGALSGRAGQAGLNLANQQQNFNNASTVAQAGLGALSQGIGAATGMMGSSAAPTVASATAQAPDVAFGSGSYGTSGYSLPGIATGSKAAVAATPPPMTNTSPGSYVNPFTGSTVTSTVPNDGSSWGDWLHDSSTLVT